MLPGEARDTAASAASRRQGRWGAAANFIIPPKGPIREHIHRVLDLPDAQQALRDVIVKVRVKINGGVLDHSHRLSDRGPTPVEVPTAEKYQHPRNTTPRCRRAWKRCDTDRRKRNTPMGTKSVPATASDIEDVVESKDVSP